jgi:hypothetical protein
MDNRRGLRHIGFALVIVTTVLPGRSFAQIDLSGEWAARLHED